jgi:uncharacterized membrane protein
MNGVRRTGGHDFDPPIASITVSAVALASSVIFLIMNSMFLVILEVTKPELGAWRGYPLLYSFLAIETAAALVLVIVSAYFLKRGLSAIAYTRAVSQSPQNFEAAQDTTSARPDNWEGRSVMDFLDASEKDIYELILSAGGSILQRNIVNQDRYSRSKVTRVIDRLERMGLVDRVRHGSTNLLVARKRPK